MNSSVTIKLNRNDLKFSAAHFTIFSATEREKIHGHNFYLEIQFTAGVGDNGISFDYRKMRKKVQSLCKKLNEKFLIPEQSDYLNISRNSDTQTVDLTFNKQKMTLLSDDLVFLPLKNITSEELSRWFLIELTRNKEELKENKISNICASISTTQGHRTQSEWKDHSNEK
tara:strand:+ start:2029 stop:2538 length:510 start_codon:yes stop_codon:yes gene_type:complete